MIRIIFLIPVFTLFLLAQAHAVQTGSGFVTTPPTVSGWSSGWTTSGRTGWDYVGQVNSASAVYLGNNWVLTAAHVGAGTFTLAGVPYAAVSGTVHTLTDGSTPVDLTLFKISTTPALNPLALTSVAPVPFSNSDNADQVVMIGYGGSPTQKESWGADTVDLIDQTVDLRPSYPYVSNDFITILGTVNNGSTSSTNNSILYSGDSGGADFIYESDINQWELAGINEVAGTATIGTQTVNVSGMVQLNSYKTQIESITGPLGVVPEPSSWVLFGIGLASMAIHTRRKYLGISAKVVRKGNLSS